MDPERMRAAVADYVTGLHRAYLAQADTFPPAVRGAMPLLTGGPLQVAAVGARNLHMLATREGLGPLRGQEVAVEGSLPGLDWTLRFYDPVVVPALGLISEADGPAYAEVRGGAGRHDGRLPRRHAAGVGADAAPRGPRRRGLAARAHGGGAGLRDDARPGAGAGGAGRRDGRGRARGARPRTGAAGPGDRPPRRGRRGAGRVGAGAAVRARTPTGSARRCWRRWAAAAAGPREGAAPQSSRTFAGERARIRPSRGTYDDE